METKKTSLFKIFFKWMEQSLETLCILVLKFDHRILMISNIKQKPPYRKFWKEN